MYYFVFILLNDRIHSYSVLDFIEQTPHIESASWPIFLSGFIVASGCIAVVMAIIILKKRYFSENQYFKSNKWEYFCHTFCKFKLFLRRSGTSLTGNTDLGTPKQKSGKQFQYFQEHIIDRTQMNWHNIKYQCG